MVSGDDNDDIGIDEDDDDYDDDDDDDGGGMDSPGCRPPSLVCGGDGLVAASRLLCPLPPSSLHPLKV